MWFWYSGPHADRDWNSLYLPELWNQEDITMQQVQEKYREQRRPVHIVLTKSEQGIQLCDQRLLIQIVKDGWLPAKAAQCDLFHLWQYEGQTGLCSATHIFWHILPMPLSHLSWPSIAADCLYMRTNGKLFALALAHPRAKPASSAGVILWQESGPVSGGTSLAAEGHILSPL